MTRDKAIKRCRENIALYTHFAEREGLGWHGMIDIERGRLEQLIADARAAAPSTITRPPSDFVVVGDHTPEPRVDHRDDDSGRFELGCV